jgi:methylated-DNA-[protein]-cysteine S-methyltransferase
MDGPGRFGLGPSKKEKRTGLKENHWASKARFGLFPASGGWCAVAWTAKGLSALVLPQKNKATAFRKLQEYIPLVPVGFWEQSLTPVPSEIRGQIKKALKGTRFRFKSFDISFLTTFQQKILNTTCQIPWGQFRTYGWVARKAGSPRGYRAAGQALNRNPIPLFIPCHRVIAGGNRLGGYGGGLEWKIKLLKNEGVTVNHGFLS